MNQVTNPAGDEFNQPNPGNKFLVVDLTIQNQATTAISVSTLLQTGAGVIIFAELKQQAAAA